LHLSKSISPSINQDSKQALFPKCEDDPLEIEVSAWHQREQRWQVGGKLTPQISLDQIMNG